MPLSSGHDNRESAEVLALVAMGPHGVPQLGSGECSAHSSVCPRMGTADSECAWIALSCCRNSGTVAASRRIQERQLPITNELGRASGRSITLSGNASVLNLPRSPAGLRLPVTQSRPSRTRNHFQRHDVGSAEELTAFRSGIAELTPIGSTGSYVLTSTAKERLF